jgi:hypothetical protein
MTTSGRLEGTDSKGLPMKMSVTFLAMTAVAMTAGCSRGGSSNNVAAGNSAANAAAPAASAAGGAAVDVAFLTGRWAENGDCAQAREFRADGTFGPPEGSTYTLSGNTLTMNLNEVGASPGPFTVARTGDDAMTLAASGSSVTLTRCR